MRKCILHFRSTLINDSQACFPVCRTRITECTARLVHKVLYRFDLYVRMIAVESLDLKMKQSTVRGKAVGTFRIDSPFVTSLGLCSVADWVINVLHWVRKPEKCVSAL